MLKSDRRLVWLAMAAHVFVCQANRDETLQTLLGSAGHTDSSGRYPTRNEDKPVINTALLRKLPLLHELHVEDGSTNFFRFEWRNLKLFSPRWSARTEFSPCGQKRSKFSGRRARTTRGRICHRPNSRCIETNAFASISAFGQSPPSVC